MVDSVKTPKTERPHKYIDKREVNGRIEYLYLGETWPEKDRAAAAERVKDKRKKRLDEANGVKSKAQELPTKPRTPEELESQKYATPEAYVAAFSESIMNNPKATLAEIDAVIAYGYKTWENANLDDAAVSIKLEEHNKVRNNIKKLKDLPPSRDKVLQGKVDEHEVQHLADVNNNKADILRSEGRISDKKLMQIIERIKEKVQKVSDRLLNNVTERYGEFWEYAEENLLFYHGTNETFDQFKNPGGNGIYFTTSKQDAESFANAPQLAGDSKAHVVMKVALDIKNPAPQEKIAAAYAKASGGNPVKMAIDDLRSQGYDGIIRASEIVIFDTKQAYTEKQLKEVWDASYEEFQEKKRNTGEGLRVGQPKIGMWGMEDTVARERFDIPNLQKLSFGGSDRDVYLLPNGDVLKVAKSPRGLDQNDWSSDSYTEEAGMTPKTIEVGKNYIVKEHVDKPDSATRAMIRKLKKIQYSGWESQNLKASKDRQAVDIINKYTQDADGENGLGDDFVRNYNTLWGDMTSIRNWGTKKGKPILLDEGTLNGDLVKNAWKGKYLEEPTFREIYYQSRAAKKQFKDADNKTKY